MKIKKALCCSCIGITLLVGTTTMSIADDWLRSNGTDWMIFGPAIITSCSRIELHLNNQGPTAAEKTFTVLRKDSNFNNIKSWISGNFNKKLGFSPKEPSMRAQSFGNYLVLYSSASGGMDDRLLVIPINLRTSGPEYSRKLAEIKALMVAADRSEK